MIIAVCFALAVFYFTVIVPRQKLDKAIALMNSGDYKGAYVLLKGLNYKDSSELRDTVISVLYPSWYNKKIGDTVVLGAWEQDNNTSNGSEAVEWQVLDRQENRLLLISRYALDCQSYNTEYTDVTWERSSLRTWLNGAFLNEAFSAEEQTLIPQVTVSADKNPKYSMDPGNSTSDRIFLLSISEADRYFASDEARKVFPTAYAKAQGAYTYENTGTTWWWLRSPGYYQSSAALVGPGGFVEDDGLLVDYSSGAVRPALWIDL